MATRDNDSNLSTNEREFLIKSLHSQLRPDGRNLMEYRKMTIEFRRVESESQAEIQLGRTRVLAVVSGEVVVPYPDRPTEGFFQCNVEFSPMASASFEPGRPSEFEVELSRIVERGIRDSKALDTEALAIVSGEKVWQIRVTIHVLDHGGNLVDAVSFAAIASMMHFRRPDVTISQESVVLHNANEVKSVPLSLHHIPLCVTFYFLKKQAEYQKDNVEEEDDNDILVVVDPSDREEKIMEGNLTFTFNSFRELCAVHKIGGLEISREKVLQYANIAANKALRFTELLKEKEQLADEKDLELRRNALRGKQYVDNEIQKVDTPFQEDEIEEMTNFSILHQPIPLKEETKEKNDGESMKNLLNQVEAASLASKEEGLPVRSETREHFEKIVNACQKSQVSLSQLSQTSSLESNPIHPTSSHSSKDSDSEEEATTMQQSEFSTVKTENAMQIDDDEENSSSSDEDLSAAIKSKTRKR